MAKPFDVSLMASKEIRFLTKPMVTYDNTLIDQNGLRRHIHLSDPQQWGAPKTGYRQLGQLGVLPPEILFKIFDYTTVDSLMNLRTTNSSFKALIEAWPTFQDAMTDAQPAVSALIATKASKLWTFSNLRPLIYTSTCHYCKQHGEILHLLKLKRVCFKCVSTRRELLAVSEAYAKDVMGLSPSNIQQLPHLIIKPQRSSWGMSHVPQISVVDYTAALKSAKAKRWSPQQFVAGQSVELKKTIFVLPTTLISRQRLLPAKQSIIHRRNINTQNDLELPQFLVDPAESSGIQHACCVHLPALQPATTTAPAARINALLCAGCSFYYNYHSTLPHQAHTLYPHSKQALRSRQTRSPQKATATPARAESNTPLHEHLKSCIYAQTFYKALYPKHLQATPENRFLATNGGTLTPQALNNRLEYHVLAMLADSTMQHRHFPRHPIDSSGVVLNQAQNNANFEMISLDLLEAGNEHKRIRCATGLEIELEEVLRKGEDKELIELMTRPDEEFDLWTQRRFEHIRAHTGAQPEYVVDKIGDVLLSTSATVSQANWALARPNNSMNMFGNWKSLFMERKRKAEDTEQRMRGGKRRKLEIGGHGWGFDRFGCINEST